MQQVKLPHADYIDGYIRTQLGLVFTSLALNLTTMSIMTQLDYLNKYTAYEMNFTVDQYYFYSHNIDEMLINCYYNNKPCSAKDFKYSYSMSSGSCYTFNSGKFDNGTTYDLKKSTTPGRRNGLSLELYSGNFSKQTWQYDFIRSTGIQLYILNSSSYALTDAEGVFLPNGYETDISIQKVKVLK